MKKLSCLLILVSLFALSSCKKKEIKLEKSSIELYVGETYQIEAHLENSKKEVNFDYSSSNQSVAFVSNDGVILANSAGSATVEVSYKNTSTILNVTVKEKQTYKLIFKVDDSVYCEYSFVEGETISWPNVMDPSKVGYLFTGWDNEVILVMPSNDVVYNATFTKLLETCTVEFIVDENAITQGVNFSKLVEKGDPVTKPDDPTKTGYTFKGWTLNGVAYDFTTPVNTNITLVASWEEEQITPATYTITFDSNGGSNITSQTITEGAVVTKPTDPTKSGYTFMGWLLNGTLYDFTTPVNTNITLVASWVENTVTTYTVTFDVDGGAYVQESKTVVEGSTITEPAVDPVKTGYEFLGWMLNGVLFDFSTPITSNITLVASWQEIPDETAPVISLKANSNLKYVVYLGEEYDLLEDVIATDDIDGDVTSDIEIVYGKFNDKVCGTYEITYKVSDSSGNEGTYIRRVAVMEKKNGVMFIGHAGCYSGLENTETAFIAAATQKQYDAMEADLRQTKDGVFVLEHDETFAGLTLASTNWADLKDVEYTATRGGISYTSKICTLDRYFEICKEYNKKAVIELKWSNGINNNDQSRMDELMTAIKNADMLDKVIFLASQYKCLEWVRNNGYSDIPCQYLVNSIESDTYFERCTTWGFDISFNISSTNTQTWIEKYQAAGVKVACYTFSQYTTASDLQKWLNMGVDAVTCDVLTRNDVNVPTVDNSDDYLYEYKLTFKDIDGNVIEEIFVKEGYDALAPTALDIAGYTFIGWDKSLTNIQEDMEVKPVYEETIYTITYESNINTITEATWSTKEEFVTEFYTDLFNFFKSNVNNIDELTFDGTTYKLVLNTSTYGTASWSTVDELKNVNISNFEQTVGLFIYKPLTVTNYDGYIPEADEGYFLNSNLYRIKYKALNSYFLNAIVNNYNWYNTEYKPTSAGKVQIFYRFHQWQQGTNIPQFNTLPKKYIVEGSAVEPTMPNNPTTYTISTNTIELLNPTCDGYTFLGWYLNDVQVTSIEKGTTGNLILVAKWQKNE